MFLCKGEKGGVGGRGGVGVGEEGALGGPGWYKDQAPGRQVSRVAGR